MLDLNLEHVFYYARLMYLFNIKAADMSYFISIFLMVLCDVSESRNGKLHVLRGFFFKYEFANNVGFVLA